MLITVTVFYGLQRVIYIRIIFPFYLQNNFNEMSVARRYSSRTYTIMYMYMYIHQHQNTPNTAQRHEFDVRNKGEHGQKLVSDVKLLTRNKTTSLRDNENVNRN